jgi:signal transduction histidine kinase
VLYLENNLTTGAFTEERVTLADVLCAQMAISVDNASLYADLEERVAARTAELKAAQARLIELERATTEQQMAGGFAHEMRNALTAARIVLYSLKTADGRALTEQNDELLGELIVQIRPLVPKDERAKVSAILRVLNENEEQIDHAVHQVDEALRRALAVTHTILEYAQLGQVRPGTSSVDIAQVVEKVVDESRAEVEAHHVTVDVRIPPGFMIKGKESHFHSILKNLISNAVDALGKKQDEAAERRLRFDAHDDEDHCVLRLEDTGVGISKENQARLFEPFFSTKPATGTGLGLGMVRKIVSLYGGTIQMDSEVGVGTTVTVTLPKS